MFLRPRPRPRALPRLPPGLSAWISDGASSPARDRAGKERRRGQRLEAIEARARGGKEAGQGQSWSEPEPIPYLVPTLPGEKKDTSGPLPDSYSPRYVEAAWYSWWERQGFFRPEYHEHLAHREETTFSLCIPPPNVTGSLHLGHALTVAIQDALVRWRRMRGSKVLWIPGCDHAGIATQALEQEKLRFVPSSLHKTWHSWLSNISDWCVSRQLWWGHRIPAYRVAWPGSSDLQVKDRWQGEAQELWAIGRTEGEARRNAANQHGVKESEVTLTQDDDVLDTWFSSALFPFAAMGWPRETPDLRNFYPNSLLETGSDLIFFWVARMVMLGQELTGELPFPQVLFHSMVRDSHSRKMSKSLGNVIDPLNVITGVSLQALHEKLQEGNLDPREYRVAREGQKRDFPHGIPECGTDALRFSLCSYKSQGEDINVDVSAFVSARRFCNKIWNAVKFTLSALPAGFEPLPVETVRPDAAIDRWILSRLLNAVSACDRGFQEYNLQAVTSTIHRYWLHELCDVYLECVKPVLQCGEPTHRETVRQILYVCVEQALLLISPLMPYLSEELWQRLPHRHRARQPSVCVSRYPTPSQLPEWRDPGAESDFVLAQEVVRAVRALRAEYHLTTARPQLYVSCEAGVRARLAPFLGPLRTLSRSGPVQLLIPREAVPAGCAVSVVSQHCQVHLLLKGLIDPGKELAKLLARQRQIGEQLSAAITRTQIPGYEEKVPERIREGHTQKVRCLRAELERVLQAVDNLQSLRKTHGDVA
ncbi:valine--tRNA ligase, mitochondrial [Hemiscyllium ocellatum]|uniref:valine--tRNA ligase, mitochondrial n=1 Tax=Hemiscyllium ocellatum TaxID=170820 RepID=UPI0029665D87|nr:valine--tRNA ligase, mitochondrial [Hemiscyllium ocellatum]